MTEREELANLRMIFDGLAIDDPHSIVRAEALRQARVLLFAALAPTEEPDDARPPPTQGPDEKTLATWERNAQAGIGLGPNVALTLIAALCKARAQAQVAEAALADLADAAEPHQCLVARLGEGTLECRHDSPCAACRVTHRIAQAERERDDLRAQLVGFSDILDVLRGAQQDGAEARLLLMRIERDEARAEVERLRASLRLLDEELSDDGTGRGLGETLPLTYHMPPSTRTRLRRCIREALKGGAT